MRGGTKTTKENEAMPPVKELQLNTVMLDYLSASTFSTSQAMAWKRLYSEDKDWLEGIAVFENYKGIQKVHDKGSSFIGQGKQKNRDHFFLWLSGELAEIELIRCMGEDAKATRIDLQATIPYPLDRKAYGSDGKWSQINLLNELHGLGHLADTRVSKGKYHDQLRTVYVLVTQKDELVRVYEKETVEGKKLLRYEVQFRNVDSYNGKAIRVSREVLKNPRKKEEVWKWSMSSLKSPMIQLAFGGVTNALAKKPKVIVNENKRNTRDWLNGVVIRSLSKYLEHNPDDTELIDNYTKLMSLYNGDTENEEEAT